MFSIPPRPTSMARQFSLRAVALAAACGALVSLPAPVCATLNFSVRRLLHGGISGEEVNDGRSGYLLCPQCSVGF